VVVSDGALVTTTRKHDKKRVVLRRISILCGKPLLTDDFQQQQQRHVVILPPYTLEDQSSTIHGLFLDEALNVAPHVPGGCTVVHLTTTAVVDAAGDADDSLLEEALKVILKSSSTGRDDAEVVDELFHVTFSYELLSPDETTELAHDDGVHIIHRPRPGLTVDHCFEQAEKIFAEICPGQVFLKMSKEMDDAVKERLGDSCHDDDDEKAVLESAVGMIGGAENADKGSASV
jgi:hypothetical protein